MESFIEKEEGYVYPVSKRLGISIYLIYRETGRKPKPGRKRLTAQDFEVSDPQPKPLEEHSRAELMALLKKHRTKARLCRATGWTYRALRTAFDRLQRQINPPVPKPLDTEPYQADEGHYASMSQIRKMRHLRQTSTKALEDLYWQHGSLQALADELKISHLSAKNLIREKGISTSRKRVDREMVDKVVEMYRAGTPVKEICDALSLHRTTIYDHLKAQNVPLRR